MITTDQIWTERMLAVLRIMTALLFMQHGFAKLFGWPHVAMFDNLQPFTLIWFAGVIEIVGSGLLLAGLFTRYAAFIMSGEMAIAYFHSHGLQAFFPILNRGELAALYCFVFLFFAFSGAGAWSLDGALGKKTH
ncbi:MAG TPA: DoxX family protein [Xanthobacteraceae bacterium]|jgi:putative oxidoreductase|nr:DoxX family protein [Xanthobacteraceae bacterium]